MNTTESAHEDQQVHDVDPQKDLCSSSNSNTNITDSADNQYEASDQPKIEDKHILSNDTIPDSINAAVVLSTSPDIQKLHSESQINTTVDVTANTSHFNTNFEQKEAMEQIREESLQINTINKIETSNLSRPSLQSSANFNSLLEQTRKLLAEIKGDSKYTNNYGIGKLGTAAFQNSNMSSPSRTVMPSVQSHQTSAIRMTTYTTLDQSQAERVQRALLRIKAEQISSFPSSGQKGWHSRSKSIPESLISNRTPLVHDQLAGASESGANSTQVSDLGAESEKIQMKTLYDGNRERIQKLIEDIKTKNETPIGKDVDFKTHDCNEVGSGQPQNGSSHFFSKYYPPLIGENADYYLQGLEVTKRIIQGNEVQSIEVKPEETKVINTTVETFEELAKLSLRKSKDTPIYQSIDVTAAEHTQREQLGLNHIQGEILANKEPGEYKTVNSTNLDDAQEKMQVLSSNKGIEDKLKEVIENHEDLLRLQNMPLNTDGLDSHRDSSSNRLLGIHTEAPAKPILGLTSREAVEGSQFTAEFNLTKHDEAYYPGYSDRLNDVDLNSKEVVSEFNTDRALELTPKGHAAQLPHKNSGFDFNGLSNKKQEDPQSTNYNAAGSLADNDDHSEQKQTRNVYNFIQDDNLEVDIANEEEKEEKDEMEIFTELERSLNEAAVNERTPVKKNNRDQEEGFGQAETSLKKGAKPRSVTFADSAQEQGGTQAISSEIKFELLGNDGKKKIMKKTSNSSLPTDPQLSKTVTTASVEKSKTSSAGKKAGLSIAGSETANFSGSPQEMSVAPGQKQKLTGDQQSGAKAGSTKISFETSQVNPFAVTKKPGNKNTIGTSNELGERAGVRESVEFAKATVNKGDSEGQKAESKELSKLSDISSKSTLVPKLKSPTQGKSNIKSEASNSTSTSISANQGSIPLQKSSQPQPPSEGKIMLLDIPAQASKTKKSEGKSTKQPQLQESKNSILKATPLVVKKR